MTNTETCTEIVFSNYEEIRREMIKMYDKMVQAKLKNPAIFHEDVTKQYSDKVKSYVNNFIANKCTLSPEEIALFVEYRFTFNNIEHIISEEGNI